MAVPIARLVGQPAELYVHARCARDERPLLPHIARVRAESSRLAATPCERPDRGCSIGRQDGEPGPAPSDSGSPVSSAPPRGQLGARLIQVHLERLDNTGALAAAETEVAVAGTEPLDLVAIPGSRFHDVSLIEGHLSPRVSPKNRTPHSPRQGCPARPDPWILMSPRFTYSVLTG
jgi:hypothetical protein